MTAVLPKLGQEPLEKQTPADDDLRLWSVTTILGVLDKPGLIYWAAGETADRALNAADSLRQRLEEDGYEATWKWLRDARFAKRADRLTAAALGTCFHAAAEEYAIKGTRPDAEYLASWVRSQGGPKFPADAIAAEVAVLQRMMDRFDDWLARFQPVYTAAEVTVFNAEYGYAGTCDGFLAINGTPLIFDYKTSRESTDARGNAKTPYPEVSMQLAAYRYATGAAVWRPRRMEKYRRRYYLLSEAEQAQAVPLPEVEAGIVIHCTPDTCEAFPARCDETVFDSFLYCLEVARWSFDLASDVIGTPLIPSGGDV